MIRNLKALGFLVAAIAVSAVAAASSSAQTSGKFTSEGPVTLRLIGTAGTPERITLFGIGIECPGSIYTGHKLNATPHVLMPSGATEITVTPHYINCAIASTTLPVTVYMNGCDYVVQLNATTGGMAATYGATTSIVCPVGKKIEVAIFTNATKHGESKPFCIQSAGSQAGLKGLHASDTGNGFIDLAGTVEGAHSEKVPIEGNPFCPLTPITSTGGRFDLDLKVEGLNGEGAPTALAISE
jgi:hypothetical protein